MFLITVPCSTLLTTIAMLLPYWWSSETLQVGLWRARSISSSWLLIEPQIGTSEGRILFILQILSFISILLADICGNQTIDIDLKIKAKYLNRTLINYNIKTIDINEQIDLLNCSVEVLTLPPQLLRTKIFLRSIPFIVIFISIQMGILLDIVVLKELVHRPIAVAIGFICQYGLMPMIAFTITKIFQYPPLYGFGLFAVGCCPGGSTSNQLTVIFDGDINLSVLMSFVSTLTSFLMMPIWFYTLGNYAYLHELKIIIPFQSLMRSLATTVVSLSIGMIIVYFFPKLKPYVHRIVKPVSILLLFYFFIFGTYVNFYLFAYINLRMALTTPLLPWVGYILGGVVAWIFQQDWIRIKTIGIETGIQNVGIAFLVLLYSLPEPENHQSTVIAMIVSYISSQPFYIILLIRFIRKKCFKKKEVQIKNIVEVDVKLKDELENSSKSMIKFHQEVDHDLQKVPLSSIV
ncbi:unnamed protein product [Rotaria sp. Silwood1]|nr:unnamed protein product [Rotaria sp. Silwood1]